MCHTLCSANQSRSGKRFDIDRTETAFVRTDDEDVEPSKSDIRFQCWRESCELCAQTHIRPTIK
jgi:hypothetical protein